GTRGVEWLDADRSRLSILSLHRRRFDHARVCAARRRRNWQTRSVSESRQAQRDHFRAWTLSQRVPIFSPRNDPYRRRAATHRALLSDRFTHLPDNKSENTTPDRGGVAYCLLPRDDESRGAGICAG